MSKVEKWLLIDWEPKVTKEKKSLSWMKEQYEASDVEVELEAITNILTHMIGYGYLDARELGDEELYRKMTQLEKLAKNMEAMSARESLSVKHMRCSERKKNVKIS